MKKSVDVNINTNGHEDPVAVGCASCFVIIFIQMIIPGIIGCFTWPYAINFWLDFVGNEGPRVAWYVGGILGMIPIVGYAGILGAVFTFILSFFIA